MLDQDRQTGARSKTRRQPAIFLSHGSPMVAIEYDAWNENVCAFIDEIPKPGAIVIVSAHWQSVGEVQVTSSRMPEILYDFDQDRYPETLMHLTYPCEGQPKLANEIAYMLRERNIKVSLNEERGIDHGAWIPMYVTFPNVDVPIIEVSLRKGASPKDVYEVGRTLAPLRDRGVMLIGSGNIVNNKDLSNLDDKYAETDDWATEFDDWFQTQLDDFNIDNLLEYEKQAPHVNKAVSSRSHILPLFFTLGAMFQKDHVVNLYEGFHYGNISMRSFALVSRK